MRNYHFNLRRLLRALSAFRLKVKILDTEIGLASLSSPFSKRTVKKRERKENLPSFFEKGIVYERSNPPFLLLNTPFIRIPHSSFPQIKKPASPLPFPFSNPSPLKLIRTLPMQSGPMKEAIRIPLMSKGRDIKVKKAKIPTIKNHLTIKRKNGERIPSSVPRITPLSKRGGELFRSFLLSLRRRMNC